MKAKFLTTLVGLAVIGVLAGILQTPTWALVSTFAICAAVFYATNGIKRDLARIQCELTGHWAVKFRPVDPEQSPEQVMERGEFWDVMNGCLSALPERIANVFSLREMDGMTSEEICEVLSLSPNNFWVIMHRARMQLRRCIEIKWFRKAI